jgi:hypothetical protein
MACLTKKIQLPFEFSNIPMMFGKMSKHQYVDDYVLSNMVQLFVSNKAWMFAISHMEN